jgi:hypothetical protein
MNQDAVKERLQKLHESSVDYTVIFSGRKNRKSNGFYEPGAKRIIMHRLKEVEKQLAGRMEME